MAISYSRSGRRTGDCHTPDGVRNDGTSGERRYQKTAEIAEIVEIVEKPP